MTIGSQFLARLNEAKEKPTKKAYTFDRGTEAMKRVLRDIGGKNNFADKIAEVLNMVGVPGMYLNKPEVRESVIEAAQDLRTKPARVAAFLSMHQALASFHGVQPVVQEAKEEDLEGQGFQQLVEEIMISLGIPEEMVTSAAKPAIRSGIRRTVTMLKTDTAVRTAVLYYAKMAKIRLNDAIVGIKKLGAPKVVEAVTTGTVGAAGKEGQEPVTNVKDFTAVAKTILKALGVDLADTSVVRVVNENMLNRSIKTAMRDGKVKRAAGTFLRTLSQGE